MKTEQHAPGSHCRVDLVTTDRQAAKSFYRALFGWTHDDQPIDQEGRQLYSHGLPRRAPPPPPSTPSRMNSGRRASPRNGTSLAVEEVGGSVAMSPIDIAAVGRIAVVLDPQGAAIGLLAPETPAP